MTCVFQGAVLQASLCRPGLKSPSGVSYLSMAKVRGAGASFLSLNSSGDQSDGQPQKAKVVGVKGQPPATPSCPGGRPGRAARAAAHLHEAPERVERAVQQQ